MFDYAWADAFERHGLRYYPKLLAAVPFTPVSGPRLLAASDEDRDTLVRGLVAFAEEIQVSSLHLLFPAEMCIRDRSLGQAEEGNFLGGQPSNRSSDIHKESVRAGVTRLGFKLRESLWSGLSVG